MTEEEEEDGDSSTLCSEGHYGRNLLASPLPLHFPRCRLPTADLQGRSRLRLSLHKH